MYQESLWPYRKISHPIHMDIPSSFRQTVRSWKMALTESKVHSCSYKIICNSGGSNCLPYEITLVILIGYQREVDYIVLPRFM